MTAMYTTAALALLVALSGCGNKGELFLAPVELTDEQKALLGEIDGENQNSIPGELDSPGELGEPDEPVRQEDQDELESEESRKKKAESSDTTQ